MKLVPDYKKNAKQAIDLDFLAERKQQLKADMRQQQQCLADTAGKLFTVSYLGGRLVRSFSNGMNIVDGIKIGYKIVSTIKRVFR